MAGGEVGVAAKKRKDLKPIPWQPTPLLLGESHRQRSLAATVHGVVSRTRLSDKTATHHSAAFSKQTPGRCSGRCFQFQACWGGRLDAPQNQGSELEMRIQEKTAPLPGSTFSCRWSALSISYQVNGSPPTSYHVGITGYTPGRPYLPLFSPRHYRNPYLMSRYIEIFVL